MADPRTSAADGNMHVGLPVAQHPTAFLLLLHALLQKSFCLALFFLRNRSACVIV